MGFLFDLLTGRDAKLRLGVARSYRCQCKRPIFFRNSICLGCNSPLGYEPGLGKVFPVRVARKRGTLRLTGPGRSNSGLYRFCANRDTPAGCNWLLPVCDPQTLCAACRLNRTIPDLSVPENAAWWGSIEVAKRRLVSSLIGLGLPVATRLGEDPERGLAFDFLRSPAEGPRILTGHADGIITLNVEEADDANRESVRAAMREPYRTLLGHMRHEVGHYYWYRLVDGSEWLNGFRDLFGDERQDYTEALQRHYDLGQPPDWQGKFVSAYASIHPWEDWAETWAHYLHMIDTLDTALSFGLNANLIELPFDHFSHDVLYRPDEPGAARFLVFINAWAKMTAVFNEIARSMGQFDVYPFALPRAAVGKLQFIHMLVAAARQELSTQDCRARPSASDPVPDENT